MAKPVDGDVRVPVLEGEDPWTDEELAEVREDLEFDIQRMQRAIRTAEKGLERLFDEGTEGAGRDPADVGSTNFERDQEMSLVHNARDMLDQAQTALRLFDSGQYGWCEVCGEPIVHAGVDGYFHRDGSAYPKYPRRT